MENAKQIEALNKLVVINNDRVQGYDTAVLETDAAQLRQVFSVLGGTSQNHLAELREEVIALGGEPENGTRLGGKIYRAWMDIKNALALHNVSVILDSCEQGENMALKVYDEVIKEYQAHLTQVQLDMIANQEKELQNDLKTIKDLLAEEHNDNDQADTSAFKIGDQVQQEFGSQVMAVVGFEPELVENVITQWEDELGNVITGKFMDRQLQIVEN